MKWKGTGDQLYIDMMLLQEVKRRKKSLAMSELIIRKPMTWAPT